MSANITGNLQLSENVKAAQELTNLVNQMLEQMQTSLGKMNDGIHIRFDKMTKDIDE